MPRDKQRDAALELLIAAPEGSAGAILADFTGEEVAAMLAHASAEEHAKLVAELVKEDPEKASDVLAAMPTEKAGAALSVVVAGLNNGTGAGLSEAEQFALFVAAPADALKSVDPPTALGTMCASALTPSQAADVLEKLDPNAAAAALEGMSGEEVRQVLEASAMRSVAEGNPASDTPLVAAMVPYMASLDGAGAAAMIEAMPADMAVGVMMNTPETRAKEVLAHTKNTALKERVTNRATMYMPACDIVLPKDDDGRTIAARAGEKYAIQVVARERRNENRARRFAPRRRHSPAGRLGRIRGGLRGHRPRQRHVRRHRGAHARGDVHDGARERFAIARAGVARGCRRSPSSRRRRLTARGWTDGARASPACWRSR